MELIQGVSVLVLLLVLVVHSQSAPNIPTPCCLPDIFNVTITDLNTVNSDKIKMQFLQTDFVAKRQLIQTIIFSPASPEGLSPSSTEVLDFDVGKLYATSALDPTVCHVTDSSLKPGQCIPSSSSLHLGSLYTGSQSSPLGQYGWRYTRTGTPSVSVTISVSQDGCIPLVQSFSSTGQNGALLLYTNFASSGNFPPIEVPQNCANGPTPSGTHNHYVMHGLF